MPEVEPTMTNSPAGVWMTIGAVVSWPSPVNVHRVCPPLRRWAVSVDALRP